MTIESLPSSSMYPGVEDFFEVAGPLLESLFQPIVERVQMARDGVDLSLPDAHVVFHGRLKELVPAAVVCVEGLLTDQKCLSALGPLVGEVKALVRQFFGVAQASSADVCMTMDGFIDPLEEEKAWALQRMRGRLCASIPSSLEELESSLLLFQAILGFFGRCFSEMEVGAQEKILSDEERVMLQAMHQQTEKLQSMAASFEDFVVNERMRVLFLGRNISGPRSSNFASQAFHNEFFVRFMEFFGEFCDDGATCSLTKEVSLDNFERASLLKTELALESPEIQGILSFMRKIGGPLITSFLRGETLSFGPFPPELLEKYSKEEIVSIMLDVSLLSLVPDIARQLEPLFLRLCKVHVQSILPSLSLEEFVNDLLRSLRSLRPDSEVGLRFTAFWVQQLELFSVEEMRLEAPPAKKVK